MEIILTQKPKLYYGWFNVLVAFVGLALSYAMFTVFSFGIFVGPFENEFGWSRQELALGLTITNLTIVFVSPLLGSIIDKIGVRRVMLTSILLMGLSVAAMSQIGPHLWQFYALYFLIPFFGAGTLPLSYSRVLISWFNRRRGLALGIALSGFGVGAATIPPLAQWLIDNVGWRDAYLAFAMLIFFINFPLTWWLLRQHPVDGENETELNGQTNNSNISNIIEDSDKLGMNFYQALKTRSFWLISVSFLLVGVGITSILAHLIPILIGRGVEPGIASLCMSSLGIGLIVGRIVSGFFMDRFFAPYIAALFLAGLCVGILILASGTTGTIIFLAAVLVGLATGSEISEIAYIVSRYFGPKAFGLIYGVMFAAFQLGSAFGAPGLAAYYDQYGNYNGALYCLAGIVAVGAIMMLLLRAYPKLPTPHKE